MNYSTTGDGTELWQVPEVERRTSLSRSFLYLLMSRGELAYVKIGRTRRIPRTAVEDLIRRHLSDPKKPTPELDD